MTSVILSEKNTAQAILNQPSKMAFKNIKLSKNNIAFASLGFDATAQLILEKSFRFTLSISIARVAHEDQSTTVEIGGSFSLGYREIGSVLDLSISNLSTNLSKTKQVKGVISSAESIGQISSEFSSNKRGSSAAFSVDDSAETLPPTKRKRSECIESSKAASSSVSEGKDRSLLYVKELMDLCTARYRRVELLMLRNRLTEEETRMLSDGGHKKLSSIDLRNRCLTAEETRMLSDRGHKKLSSIDLQDMEHLHDASSTSPKNTTSEPGNNRKRARVPSASNTDEEAMLPATKKACDEKEELSLEDIRKRIRVGAIDTTTGEILKRIEVSSDMTKYVALPVRAGECIKISDYEFRFRDKKINEILNDPAGECIARDRYNYTNKYRVADYCQIEIDSIMKEVKKAEVKKAEGEKAEVKKAEVKKAEGEKAEVKKAEVKKAEGEKAEGEKLPACYDDEVKEDLMFLARATESLQILANILTIVNSTLVHPGKKNVVSVAETTNLQLALHICNCYVTDLKNSTKTFIVCANGGPHNTEFSVRHNDLREPTEIICTVSDYVIKKIAGTLDIKKKQALHVNSTVLGQLYSPFLTKVMKALIPVLNKLTSYDAAGQDAGMSIDSTDQPDDVSMDFTDQPGDVSMDFTDGELFIKVIMLHFKLNLPRAPDYIIKIMRNSYVLIVNRSKVLSLHSTHRDKKDMLQHASDISKKIETIQGSDLRSMKYLLDFAKSSTEVHDKKITYKTERSAGPRGVKVTLVKSGFMPICAQDLVSGKEVPINDTYQSLYEYFIELQGMWSIFSSLLSLYKHSNRTTYYAVIEAIPMGSNKESSYFCVQNQVCSYCEQMMYKNIRMLKKHKLSVDLIADSGDKAIVDMLRFKLRMERDIVPQMKKELIALYTGLGISCSEQDLTTFPTSFVEQVQNNTWQRKSSKVTNSIKQKFANIGIFESIESKFIKRVQEFHKINTPSTAMEGIEKAQNEPSERNRDVPGNDNGVSSMPPCSQGKEATSAKTGQVVIDINNLDEDQVMKESQVLLPKGLNSDEYIDVETIEENAERAVQNPCAQEKEPLIERRSSSSATPSSAVPFLGTPFKAAPSSVTPFSAVSSSAVPFPAAPFSATPSSQARFPIMCTSMFQLILPYLPIPDTDEFSKMLNNAFPSTRAVLHCYGYLKYLDQQIESFENKNSSNRFPSELMNMITENIGHSVRLKIHIDKLLEQRKNNEGLRYEMMKELPCAVTPKGMDKCHSSHQSSNPLLIVVELQMLQELQSSQQIQIYRYTKKLSSLYSLYGLKPSAMPLAPIYSAAESVPAPVLSAPVLNQGQYCLPSDDVGMPSSAMLSGKAETFGLLPVSDTQMTSLEQLQSVSNVENQDSSLIVRITIRE